MPKSPPMPTRWPTCSSPIWKASGLRALGPGVDPRLDQLAELGLGARGRDAARAGVPAPADQVVLGHVVMEFGKRATAVGRRILDLAADRGQRLALPSHL